MKGWGVQETESLRITNGIWNEPPNCEKSDETGSTVP